MAKGAREVKMRLQLDGEKEFKQQIASINRELRLGNAQLKETAAAYDLNGNAQEQLANRSKILKAQLESQNRIVAEYENRLKQAKEAANLSADGLRNYEIALSGARTKQMQLLKQVQDTDKELEELGRDSRRVGNQLEDNLGDAADEVSDKFSRMVEDIDSSLKDIRNMESLSIAVDLVRGAWEMGTQAYSWAQGYSEENMRTAMARYNLETAGGDWMHTSRLAIQYASIFGDKDSALEAISNMVAAGYTGESLDVLARYLGGAAIKFQDTLKIESLADSLQETLATGEATGQIAELIGRLGYDSGTFREQVTEAKKTGQEREALVAYFRNAGLDTVYEGFVNQNQAMVDAAVAAGELNQELAELAKEVNVLLTPAIRLLGENVNWLNGKIQEAKTADDPELSKIGDIVSTFMPTAVAGVKQAVKAEASLLSGEKGLMETLAGQTIEGNETAAEIGWLPWLANQIFPNQASRKNEQYQYMRDNLAAQGINLPRGYTGGNFAQWGGDVTINWHTAETVQNEADKAAETAKEGGAQIGASLTLGLQGQTAGLLAIAQQQRELLEAVWSDPITPTVVVNYATTSGGGGKPNLPALPGSVNVTVELDKRKLGQTIVPLVDNALGGATGAFVNRFE